MSTGISYLDEVWNPVTGCSGKGCKVRENCWAREMVKRFPRIHGYYPTEFNLDGSNKSIEFNHINFHPDRLDKPLHWRKPRRIGVCFMGDLFDEQVPFDWFSQIMDIICEPSYAWNHQFFMLTKQPQRMKEFFNKLGWWGNSEYKATFPHLYLGVSITDQEDADRMIPELLRIPGKRWVSLEPMVGPVDLVECRAIMGGPCGGGGEAGPVEYDVVGNIDWLVIGCQSGPKRRPMPLEWAYSVGDQCKAAGVPVYVKQLDLGGKCVKDINEFPQGLQVRQMPKDRR